MLYSIEWCGWWIGKDTKESCLGLLHNTIPGVAGVTEVKYEKGHNKQFCGQVLNHTSPDSKSKALPLHEPTQWHYKLWLLVMSIVEKLSSLNFCPVHEIIMLLWNAGNFQPYYSFWYLQWLFLKWCLFAFVHSVVLFSSEFQGSVLPPSSGWLNLLQINLQYVTCSDYRKIY
jgi:hypothetical protein